MTKDKSLDKKSNDKKSDNNRDSRKKFLFNYVSSKITVIRDAKFNITNLKLCLKMLRKSLNLNKSPKRKGYGKLITDEEKRYI